MASWTSALLLAITSAIILRDGANASAFLGTAPTAAPESMSEKEVLTSLLQEMQAAVGHGTTDGRMTEIEEAIRPMFNALPKDQYGNLDHATVRYALHRFFRNRHGWFIKGLEMGGDHRNVSSAAGILKERVPEYMQDLIEKRMGGHGLSLREVVILASAIEHLVHSEAKGNLETTFKALNMSLTSPISNNQSIVAIDTYMMAFLNGRNLTEYSPRQVKLFSKQFQKIYPNWPETQKWIHQIHQETGGVNSPAMLDFEAVLGTIDKISEGYGRHQDTECRQLGADLLRFEDRNTGRVLISTFYKAALGGMWQFSESVDHLRQLGALDESTAQASVIIPNYIGGVSNCLAASNYYKVCCTDQCEGLLGRVEDSIASAHGEPGQILSLIRALPSATTIAPRDLPSALIERLHEIAASNGGNVPIHGRLFAQWMHHAYPRECPYPHVSGTISPRTSREWAAKTGRPASFNKSQMADHVLEVEKRMETMNPAAAEVLDETLPWTDGEELLIIPHSSPQSSSIVSRSFVRNIILGISLCSLVYAMLRPAISAAGSLKGHQSEKSYV